jgi:hypothetical protein
MEKMAQIPQTSKEKKKNPNCQTLMISFQQVARI